MRVSSRWLRDRKNWEISKARVLIVLFLAHSEWTMWVRVTPASVVDLNFNPPNWLRWTKSLLVTVNWNLSAMTFLIILPKVLRSTIGWKYLGWSYAFLLDLGIITVNECLKSFGQYPKLKHESAILITLARHLSWLRIILRCHHDNLSSSGADELLHLLITYLNSSLEKGLQLEVALCSILLRILILTWWLRAVLKKSWSAFHRLSGGRHGRPSYLMASIAGSLCLLIQFISFQGPWLLFITSWIFTSKKDLLVFLTTFSNFF